MPWHISEDFRRFKAITTPHAVIMGRKTFESIGRALPGRRNIVITRNPDARFEGCETADSLLSAIALCDPADETFIIGGGQVFAEAMPLVDKLYITKVFRSVAGDTFFPAIGQEWHQSFCEEHEGFDFLEFIRK